MNQHEKRSWIKFTGKDLYQQMRGRRMGLALIGGLAFTIICMVFYNAGFFRLTYSQFIYCFVVFWLVNALFVILMMSGLNKRFSDPSLTTAQMFWAVSATMVAIYLANESRTPLLMMSLLAIMFGGLDYSRQRVIIMSIYSLVVYALIVYALKDIEGVHFNKEKEIIILFEYFMILLGYNVLLWEMIVTRQYLKNKSLYLQSHLHRAEIESITDPLTGVGNRRFLQKVLQAQLSMVERSKEYFFAVSMLDIDRFKQVNDEFGHDVGDKVLQKVSFIINRNLRQSDTFGRFGGEEFIIISPLTGEVKALDFAERIRQIIQNTVFSSVEALKVTVSIGVTIYKYPESLDTTLKRSDKALYQAKQNGRNQIVVL